MTKLFFQLDAINKIKKTIIKLWEKDARNIPIVFKSPTGSGKTFMVASALNELVVDPSAPENISYIWITFSDNLAMQSMNKFVKYFGKSINNDLLTIQDINTKRKLSPNSILFINWQKLTQNFGSDRSLKLRKPKDFMLQKEEGLYFEDFIENTHKAKQEIVLIIDESHKNSSTQLANDIIEIMNPKLIMSVSATPHMIPTPDDIEDEKAGYIRVTHSDVVNAGLIREKIILQSKSELQHSNEDDLDLKLLELGIKRREILKEEYTKIGKKINPLMIIQLPNDDKLQKDQGLKTKEEIVIEFLKSKQVNIDKEVAYWFDGRETNMNNIDYLESNINFMLFKQAAGTGWDCPRAQVLVMFREIKGSSFYIQTIGRILRMTEPSLIEDYRNSPLLRQGYLYTNYHRDEVEIPGGNENKLVQCTHVKAIFERDIADFEISSDCISRVDYGDLVNAEAFQISFIETFNKEIGINSPCVLHSCEDTLQNMGIDINPKIMSSIITNMEITNYDSATETFKDADESINVELSNHDIEKLFSIYCIRILEEQTSLETKVGNISRSWGVLKSSLRIWFKNTLPTRTSLEHYKIFINDFAKGQNSLFRKLIIKALKNYYPEKQKLLEQREVELSRENSTTFTLKGKRCFDDTYCEVPYKKYLLNKFYLKKEYKGRENELSFASFLDNSQNIIWWYKNGDSGMEHFSLRYFNTNTQTIKLFYPDWIIRFENGTIGIFDTKNGSTLHTEGRALGLQNKLDTLGSNFIGGIVKSENGHFLMCTDRSYNDTSPHLSKWVDFGEL